MSTWNVAIKEDGKGVTRTSSQLSKTTTTTTELIKLGQNRQKQLASPLTVVEKGWVELGQDIDHMVLTGTSQSALDTKKTRQLHSAKERLKTFQTDRKHVTT